MRQDGFAGRLRFFTVCDNPVRRAISDRDSLSR
jgi:hypothetical protein